MEDWLTDPLMVFDKSKGHRIYREPDIGDNEVKKWRSFHYATRVKLEGAVYLCARLLGVASLSHQLGLPLMIHRQRAWYADTFFFELFSAYDTLLQEINVVYQLGFRMDDVRWSSRKTTVDTIKKRLSENDTVLCTMMQKEQAKPWFRNVKRYRIMAAHWNVLRMPEMTAGGGESIWDDHEVEVSLLRVMGKERIVAEPIKTCSQYLNRMIAHIHAVWDEMQKRFK